MRSGLRGGISPVLGLCPPSLCSSVLHGRFPLERLLLLFVFLSGQCQPTSGQDPAPIPQPDPVPVCDDYLTPETAFVLDFEPGFDTADLMVRWTGCGDDIVELCWSGHVQDTSPPRTELLVERYPRGTCDHDVTASMWIDLAEVREAVEDHGADEVVLEVDGLEIPWTLTP